MATIKAGTYKFVNMPDFGSNGGYFPIDGTRKIELIQFESNNTAFNSMGICIDVGEYHFAYGKSAANTSGTTYKASDITAGKVIPVYNSENPSPWVDTDDKYNTITLATDQTVSDEFYNWFNANTEKTLKQSIEQHITDAYTAIGNKSGTIPTQKNLANLAGAINTISTGVDTSDGNIEPTTVLKGYKGYAKGVAVNGAIETYDGTVEDVVVVYTDCLTFTGETSEFTLAVGSKGAKEWDGTLYYSTDHNTWNVWDGTAISSANKKLYLKGKGNTKFWTSKGARLSLSAKAGCSGNIQTLLDWESPPTSISTSNCYEYMFNGCTNLTTAPELPATTLANYCYNSMFYECTSLTQAPELPATTLAEYCYYFMFYGCTSLTQAPELPATTLAESCYNAMFLVCSSLTTAPNLPATTLAPYCYRGMFNGCSNLTTAPALPATTLANYCYGGMFYDCTNLTTAPELPAITLADNCYRSMFYGCTKLKLSTTQTTEYKTPWRIPSSGTISSEPSGWNVNMLTGTGGTFTGNPSINTTYYGAW